MLLIDVNVLLYAYRPDTVDHRRYLDWLQGVVRSDQIFGMSDLVLSGFLRIATHPRML